MRDVGFRILQNTQNFFFYRSIFHKKKRNFITFEHRYALRNIKICFFPILILNSETRKRIVLRKYLGRCYVAAILRMNKTNASLTPNRNILNMLNV